MTENGTIFSDDLRENPRKSGTGYPITQELIDDILTHELKDISFPVKPEYNPRIADNGRIVFTEYPWGELKDVSAIQIGKQDKPGRRFLVDTLLHEYYEYEILKRQNENSFFKALNKSKDTERHKWVDAQIAEFIKGLEINE